MRFLLRRLGFFVLTLWAALTLNFLIPRLMPGNPALAMMARFHGRVSGSVLAALEVEFGVNTNQSLWSQYWEYLRNTLTGHLGRVHDVLPAAGHRRDPERAAVDDRPGRRHDGPVVRARQP